MKAFRVDAYFLPTFLSVPVCGQKTFSIRFTRTQVSAMLNAPMRMVNTVLWMFSSAISVVRDIQ